MVKDMHWKAECEAAEIKISPSKSEALVLCWKIVGCLLWKRVQVLFARKREMDRWSRTVFVVMQVLYQAIFCKERAEPQFKAFNLLVCSCPDPHLWS